MKNKKSKYMFGRIGWNDYGWEKLQLGIYGSPTKGNVSPTKSLNFDFDKQADTDTHVFGYVQSARSRPRRLAEPGFVFFVTNNPNSGEQLVGIYGNAELVEPPEEIGQYNDKELGRGYIMANLKAEKSKSLMFPVPLIGNSYLDYIKDKGRRAKNLLPTGGIRYIQQDLARLIIEDEINALEGTDGHAIDLGKLRSIYELITGGKPSSTKHVDNDEAEQNYVYDVYATKSRNDLAKMLVNDGKLRSRERVVVESKHVKRFNWNVGILKKLCNYRCEICGISIPKKDGGFYIEAAHIVPVSKGGTEDHGNLMILCPNHHKEFDYGATGVKVSGDRVRFEMNGKSFEIDLMPSKRGLK